MTTATVPTEQRFVLHDVGWAFYDELLSRLGDRPVFVTYDRGSLELMSPSDKHERCAALAGRLVEELTLELGIPILSCRSTTFRREDLDRGLEPDECYYIRSEARVRGVSPIDLSRDPPPDLAIEIEISRRLLDREGIYAALGVPELWCYDGARLRVLLLGPDGRYRASDRSAALAMVSAPDLERFLALRDQVDETRLLRQFRDWVRSRLSPPAGGA